VLLLERPSRWAISVTHSAVATRTLLGTLATALSLSACGGSSDEYHGPYESVPYAEMTPSQYTLQGLYEDGYDVNLSEQDVDTLLHVGCDAIRELGYDPDPGETYDTATAAIKLTAQGHVTWDEAVAISGYAVVFYCDEYLPDERPVEGGG
jgi:hypothetical protein